MLFVPMLQAVAAIPQENYERSPAYLSEPLSVRLQRLTENQVEVWFGLLGFNASATARVISRR